MGSPLAGETVISESPFIPSRRWQTVAESIARLPLAEVAIGVAFLLSALAAIAATRSTGGAAMIWPANAVAAALLIRMPRVRWVIAAGALICAGVLANTVGAGDPIALAAAMAGVNLAEIGLTTWVFRRVARFPIPNITVIQSVQMLVLFAAVIPLATAFLGGSVIHAGLGVPLWPATRDWWASTAVGACLLGPPICLYSSASAKRLLSGKFLPQNLALVLMCLIGTYVAVRFLRFPFAVIGVPLMLVAFRVGGFGAAALSALCGLEIIGLWVHGIIPPGTGVLENATVVTGLPLVALAAILLPPTAVGLATDARRTAIRALRLNERRFRESLEHSPSGVALADLDGMWTTTNAALQKMLGYTGAELQAMSANALAHQDDRADITRRMQQLRLGETKSYEAERRFRHKDGSWIWVRAIVSLVRDEDGQPLHYIGQIESVEARRRAERALAEEHQRLMTTLRAIADAVISVDAGTGITYINAAAEELLGQSSQHIEGRRLDEVVVLTDARTLRPSATTVGRCVARGEVVRRDEFCVLHRPDGGVRFVTEVASPIFNAEGHVVGTVLVLRDASSARERDRELSHRAAHDDLTGLVNRFEFERRMQEVVDRARHVERQATVLVVDLDRFKAVNDAGGHAAGDAVLRRVGEVLMSKVRQSDTVARVGGDEFAIVLDRCGPDRARAIARQILAALNPLAVECNGATHTVGASVGLATISEHYDGVAGWIAAADRACYEAKRDGRGQVRIAQVAAA